MASSEVPLGISRLVALDRVEIRQKVTFLEHNKYAVFAPGSDQDVILYAKEDSGMMGLLMGGKTRPFLINIFDAQQKEVCRLRRPYTFGPDKMDVVVCGQLASVVRQKHTFVKPVLMVNDAHDRPVFKVKGPMNPVGECDFNIMATNGTRVGVIRKRWGSMRMEMFTKADSYDIRFPLDLDVRFKVALIGTCFLIDFLYFEN